jgi:hypothetical protein
MKNMKPPTITMAGRRRRWAMSQKIPRMKIMEREPTVMK